MHMRANSDSETQKAGVFTRSWRAHALVGAIALSMAGAEKWALWEAWVALFGVIALLLSVFWLQRASESDHNRAVRVLIPFGFVVFGLSFIPAANDGFGNEWVPGIRLAIMALGIVPLVRDMRGERHLYLWMRLLIMGLVLGSGFVTILDAPELYTDVYFGHAYAAESLADGGNPYADIEFPDSAPGEWNEGMIHGYPYPPVTMLPYAFAQWAWDSRMLSVLSLVALLGLVSRWSRRFRGAGLGTAALVASIPLTPVVIRYAWTEPWSVLLLVASTVVWSRPVAFGVLFGLAVASKQYMVLAVIPLLTMPMPDRWKRLSIAAGVCAVTILPFFLWDPQAMWSAVIADPLGRPIRGDSRSIAALGITVPVAVALVAAVVLGLLAGRLATSPGRLLAVQAATFGVYFLLTPNTFGNYWYLVTVLAFIATTMKSGTNSDDETLGADARDESSTVYRTVS